MSAHTTRRQDCGDAEQNDQLPRATGVLDRATPGTRRREACRRSIAHRQHHDRDGTRIGPGQLREERAGNQHRCAEDGGWCDPVQQPSTSHPLPP